MSAAPDVIGEVEAWRSWYVMGPYRAPRLFSISTVNDELQARLWPGHDWLVAQCAKAKGHAAPDEDCSCGIYALDSHKAVVANGYTRLDDALVVVGRVALAGKIVPGERGYRAERARPVELRVPFEHWRLVSQLGSHYGIPRASRERARARPGASMDIGTEGEPFVAEPLEDPFRAPETPVEEPIEEPVEVPA